MNWLRFFTIGIVCKFGIAFLVLTSLYTKLEEILGGGGIQTTDLWHRKQSLYELCHKNLYPIFWVCNTI